MRSSRKLGILTEGNMVIWPCNMIAASVKMDGFHTCHWHMFESDVIQRKTSLLNMSNVNISCSRYVNIKLICLNMRFLKKEHLLVRSLRAWNREREGVVISRELQSPWIVMNIPLNVMTMMMTITMNYDDEQSVLSWLWKCPSDDFYHVLPMDA